MTTYYNCLSFAKDVGVAWASWCGFGTGVAGWAIHKSETKAIVASLVSCADLHVTSFFIQLHDIACM